MSAWSAPFHAPDKCLLEAVRESLPRGCDLLRLLQFLPCPPNASRDSGDGGWFGWPRLGTGGTSGSFGGYARCCCGLARLWYSPAVDVLSGNPDRQHISTSYTRENRSMKVRLSLFLISSFALLHSIPLPPKPKRIQQPRKLPPSRPNGTRLTSATTLPAWKPC
jgi:hypothetical protein